MLSLYARALDFYERRKPLVYGGAVVIVVLLLLIPGYIYYQMQRGAEAQEHLSRIVTQYEQGNYDVALDGTEDRLGLREIADQFGGTDAGNMAAFYAANALYEMGELDEALAYFEQVREASSLVGASALAGRAAIHEDRGEYAQAAELYSRAASIYDTGVSSPQHLLSAARAFEEAGDYEEALRVYEDLRERYPEKRAADGIEVDIARMEARIARAQRATS